MSIWFAPFTLAELNRTRVAGLAAHLGIVFSGAGADWLAATMPVAEHTRQPMGLLHGGASFALADSLALAAGNLCVERRRARAVLQEINGNHLRGVRDGLVTATARAPHLGQRSQVWQVEIRDPAARLVCVARLTLAVVPVA